MIASRTSCATTALSVLVSDISVINSFHVCKKKDGVPVLIREINGAAHWHGALSVEVEYKRHVGELVFELNP